MRLSLPFFSGVNDFDEVVFERRNKLYGAYELRQHYNERLQKAFLFSLSMILLSILALYLFRHKAPPPFIQTWDTGPVVGPPPIIEPDHGKIKPQVDPPPARSNAPMAIINDTTHVPESHEDTASHIAASGDNLSQGNTGDIVSLGTGTGEAADTVTTHAVIKDPNEVVNFAKEMPSFPGGAPALARYLAKKFDCNDSNHGGFSREGKIILKFVVMKDGTIKDITVLQETVSIDCVEQAKKLILNGPKWNPGKQNNEAVNVMVVQPIIFAVE